MQGNTPAPSSEEELMQRANLLTGLTIESLATTLSESVPELSRSKGWVGQLIEKSLGASAGSQALPDFPHLGIELKTIPVDEKGVPKETTYVCTVPLHGNMETNWYDSWVYRKLKHVLWLPVLSIDAYSPSERIIGTPLLWRMTHEVDAILQQDWNELAEMITLGQYNVLSASIGQWLHIRPKAANSKCLTQAVGEEGQSQLVNPRGYYLRRSFTQELFKQNFTTQGL